MFTIYGKILTIKEDDFDTKVKLAKQIKFYSIKKKINHRLV